MAITKVLSNVVVRGIWNVAIFSHEWLNLHEVAPKLEPNVVPEAIWVPQTGQQILQYPNQMTWAIDPNSLEIKIVDDWSDCSSYASGILKLLPHTPIQAVGTNFVFNCPIPEWPQSMFPALGEYSVINPKEDATCTVSSAKWAGVLQLEPNPLSAKVTLTVSQKNDRNSIAAWINVHHAVNNSQEAIRITESWEEDKALANKVIQECLKLDLKTK